MSSCRAAIPFDALVEYWLGDTDEATTNAIEEHLLGCDVCGAQLDDVIALGQGVRAAFDDGLVGVCVGAAFIDRLAARGTRVREYRVPRNGSVECSVAPDDELLVSRLQAPLAGVTRLDVVARSSLFDGEQRRQDVPFDSASGEVVLAPKLADVRRLPANRLEIRLIAVEAGGERLIGHYTLNHTPWPPAGRL